MMSLNSNILNEKQLEALSELFNNLSNEQTIWLSGYFQGRLSLQDGSVALQLPVSSDGVQGQQKLTILYGTHTGRCQGIANQLAEAVSQKGWSPNVVSMEDYKVKQIAKEENLAVIISTHGEGEPPDMAEDFHSFITGKRASKLSGVNYSVIALGDRSYKLYCQTGIEIDQSLQKLGATEILPIVTCDVDFEEDAENWVNSFVEKLSELNPEQSTEGNVQSVAPSASIKYSKKNPFYATVLEKVKITGRDSDKEVYHLELSLEDSGLNYEPGDSLGVVASNPSSLVEGILEKTGIEPEGKIKIKEEEVTVKEALTNHYEITLLTRDVIRKYNEKVNSPKLKEILEDEEQLENYLYGHDLLDLLESFSYAWTPTDFFQVLRNLPSRLYSISSSQEAVGEEVHITVAAVRYKNKGRKRVGACSSYLSDTTEIDDKVPVYIDKNPSFKLPSNGAPIIMVGAGTGIAPYRAFLQERESNNQKGKSWLFFGDRRFYSDFLYQTEWQKLIKKGYLEKMDVAFSRDQKDKIYVQHRLEENQKEIFKWLEDGGVFYLCGDMKFMAKDVNKTMLEIIQTQGGISEEKAKEYVKKLKKEKRYQVDVY